MAEVVRERQRQYAQQDLWDKFWKDKYGKVVIYQRPNILLIGWLVITVASLFSNGSIADVLWYVALGVLTVWSLLEIFKGANYFRRAFGVIVIILVGLAVFKVGY